MPLNLFATTACMSLTFCNGDQIMNKRKTTLLAILLAWMIMILGCGKNLENEREDSQEPSTTQNSSDITYPRLTRMWVNSNGQEESLSGGIVTSTKSLKFIDEYFQALEWNKPEKKPVIVIALSDADSLEIRLLPNSPSDRPAYVAVWTRPGPTIAGATSSIVKQSQRLDSSEQAIGLLRSYTTEKGDVEELAEWKGQ